MLIKKIIFSLLLYFFFILFQTSFLPNFSFLDHLNLILIGVIIWNLTESPKSNFGLFNALIGGFFLDIFSDKGFGFYIIILLLISFFIKFVVKKYVHFSFFFKN